MQIQLYLINWYADKAEPTVVKVVSFNGDSEDELASHGCMFGGTFSSFYGKGCC